MKKTLTILIAWLCMNTVSAQIAQTVLQNGKIYVGSNTFVEAVAIKDGKIIYLGTTAGAAVHIGATTDVSDIAGRLVIPGLHDVHMHPLEASSAVAGSCILSNTETNAENFIQRLRDCALTANANGWKMASGHYVKTVLNAPRMAKLILDDVDNTTPLLVMEKTSHSIWVNSKALQVMGITSATPDPPGGHIVKNAMGEPTGVLLDNAGDDLLQVAVASSPATDTANYNGLVNYGLPLLAKNGITSFSEARTYYKRNYITIWNQIKTDNKLTARAGLAPWLYPSDNDVTQIAALKAMYSAGDDMLKIRQLKVYADGIIINATAALNAPYDNNLGLPFNTGLNYFTQARLTAYITDLEKTGYDFHIHAIGDRGIKEGLNAVQAAQAVNKTVIGRHRISHVEMVDPADYPRFASLNVVADMQVAGDFTQPANWSENTPLVGATRANNWIPLKSIFNAGAKITLSSDWDVSGISPFIGMQNALTRTPQELPNIEEVIKAYTINSAFVMRQEAVTGSITLGKYADLVVLDRDLFTIATTDIKNTKVLWTLLGGRTVYRDAALPLKVTKFAGSCTAKQIEFELAQTLNTQSIALEMSDDTINWEMYKSFEVENPSEAAASFKADLDEWVSYPKFFRLKQISKANTEDLSEIIRLNCNEEGNQITLFPNPAPDAIWVKLGLGLASAETTFHIFNTLSQEVKSGQVTAATFKIDIASLPKGSYIIQFKSPYKTIQKTFVKA